MSGAAAAPTTCSMKEAARKYGFSGPIVKGRQITMEGKSHRIVFEINSRRCLYDGVAIWLNGPVVSERGVWRMAMADVDKTLTPLLAPSKGLARAGFSRIVIEAGHGGDDLGASGHRRGSH